MIEMICIETGMHEILSLEVDCEVLAHFEVSEKLSAARQIPLLHKQIWKVKKCNVRTRFNNSENAL